MKCKKCGGPAAINMRQHKLGLCETHFVEWLQGQTERFITKYAMFGHDQRVLVAVSGGKDSLALWDVLLTLGYHADGLYVNLGIDEEIGYSNQSLEMIHRFLETRPNADLYVVDIPAQYGVGIPEAAKLTLRGQDKPCSVCGLVKRHEMNRIAGENNYDVLATGHNLDDEAAVLFGNTLHWQLGYLARQAPVLPARADGLARKVKPFFRFYERETAAYALIRGIDYIYDECPFAKGATSIRHKMVLSEMERHAPGTKLHFYLGFLRARKLGVFDSTIESQPEMQACSSCGQATTAGDLCAYCRMWNKVKARKG